MGWVLALQGGVSSLWVRQDRKARRLPLPTPLPWPSKRCHRLDPKAPRHSPGGNVLAQKVLLVKERKD